MSVHARTVRLLHALAVGRGLAGMLSRFSVVGIGATLTYLLVSNLLISLDAVPAAVASLLAYLAGMLVSYLGQSRLTFRVDRHPPAQLARFCVLSIAGIAISYATVAIAEHGLGVAPFWGTVATVVLVPLLSFVLMRAWVFGGEAEAGDNNNATSRGRR